ncbi:MAG TPA: hypothetical protein DCP20_01350 [Coriobacteriia bacterium]|nr:hypothetical protein [Coriobacteriia bacterium]
MRENRLGRIDIQIVHGSRLIDFPPLQRSALWSLPVRQVRGGPIRLVVDMPSGIRPRLLAVGLLSLLIPFTLVALLSVGYEVAPLMRICAVPLWLVTALAIWRERSVRETLEIDSRLVTDSLGGDIVFAIPRTQFVNLRVVTGGAMKVTSIAWGGAHRDGPAVGAGIGLGLGRRTLEELIARIEEFGEQVPAEPIE